MDACSLEPASWKKTGGENHAYFHESWGKKDQGGKEKKVFKHCRLDQVGLIGERYNVSCTTVYRA